jgi:hypothetical protein
VLTGCPPTTGGGSLPSVSSLSINVSNTGVITGATAPSGSTLSYYIVATSKATEIAAWTLDTTKTAAEAALGVDAEDPAPTTLTSAENGRYLVVVAYKDTADTVTSRGQSNQIIVGTPAGDIAGAALAADDTTAGSTKLTYATEAGSGNSLKYGFSETAVAALITDNEFASGTAFTSPATIALDDVATGKGVGGYITLYEIVTSTHKVVAYVSIPITNAKVKQPVQNAAALSVLGVVSGWTSVSGTPVYVVPAAKYPNGTAAFDTEAEGVIPVTGDGALGALADHNGDKFKLATVHTASGAYVLGAAETTLAIPDAFALTRLGTAELTTIATDGTPAANEVRLFGTTPKSIGFYETSAATSEELNDVSDAALIALLGGLKTGDKFTLNAAGKITTVT